MISDILRNKKRTTILVTIIVPIIVCLLLFAGFLNTYELKISDAFYSPGNVSDDIIIISIDDVSLQDLGRWPWPRTYFADVLNKLNQSLVIGIDVSFFEPAEGDEELADAIKQNNVVLAMEYINFSIINNSLFGNELLKPTNSLGIPGTDFSVGYVNLYTDSDGVTRSFSPSIDGIENHNHFSMMVVKQITGVLPSLDQTKMLIKFYSLPGDYTTLSFSDVINGDIDSTYFDGKIILIGATAQDLHDNAVVPISNQAMSGVEINANIVQSILFRDHIHYQDTLSTLLLIFIFAFFASLVIYKFKIHIATIFVFIIGFVFIFISIQLYEFGLIMNIIFPIFSMSSVYVILLVYYYITEEKDRRWITDVFGKYVSPLVIENLIKNPDLIDLGGERRNLSIFFSDIRGFTSISERIKPEELVHLLNEYLTEMTSIIIENNGLVDKYMGDAIMAFWGSPMDQPDHAIRACHTSLKMIERLKILQQKWKERNIPIIDIGIGVNTGDAIVGNMGSEKRFDYTAIGDNVNLASRLEGLNKIYGTNIIISQYTYNRVKGIFSCRKLDVVKVKGRDESVFIYELVGGIQDIDKQTQSFINYYEKGFKNYIDKKWKKAMENFQKALSIRKNDLSTKLMIQRSQRFLENPPDTNWDGVWEMKSK